MMMRAVALAVFLVLLPEAAHGQATLAELLERALPGDTVLVKAGTHTGPVLRIDVPLTLIGQDWPVLDGQGERGMVEIHSDSVSIQGFVFRNTGVTFMEDRAAVRVVERTACDVSGNRFENTFFGLYLAESSDCTVSNNVFVGQPDREVNGGNAIHSWYSHALSITGNTISGHRDGIYLEFTTDSHIADNASFDNLRYGLHFMFSDRCVYRDNTFERNGAGVAVMYAEDVEMLGNLFGDSWGPSSFGLLLKEIKGGSVTDNLFRRNTVALHVESTDRIEFLGNHFVQNGWAVRVMADAVSNTFRHNSFVRNTFDVSTNSRHTSRSTFERNYWDRYTGYDLDRDGWGDQPFHPVRLYSLLVERHEPALFLLRSPLVVALDAMEYLVPLLTPQSLVDLAPSMEPFAELNQ